MHLSFQSEVARSNHYRSDIDGLRALAVLPVVFYHAQLVNFSGGFVGVDVFYVISGYLITSLILKDDKPRQFSFLAFYERRIRRIFPALFGVVFFCTAAAALLFSPSDLMTFGKGLLAMTFFSTNILFASDATGGGYFGQRAEGSLLLHTWSLSVEEQFYLFFPTILLLCVRWNKRRAKFLVLVLALISFAICLWETKYRPMSAFYIFIPRAWELLLGALLAMKLIPPLKVRVLREIAGVAGISLILSAVFAFSERTVFPGFSALVPCLGACLVIYGGEDGRSWVNTALGWAPLVFVGVISYSLYLWHWPLIVLARYLKGSGLTQNQTAIVILCSFLLAFASYEFVEKPFRGRGSRFDRRQIFLFGAGASVLSACMALALYVDHGFPGRYDAQTQKLIMKNTSRKDDFEDVCGNWKNEIHRMDDIAFCSLGPASATKIMFWGDSHVQQLYPLIRKLYGQGDLGHRGVLTAIANACVPAETLNDIRPGYHCDSFSHFAMLRANQPDIDTVFIGFSAWWYGLDAECPSIEGRCTGRISSDAIAQRFVVELGDHIAELKRGGKRVVVSLPFPAYDRSIPDLEIRNAIFGRFGLARQVSDVSSLVFRGKLESMITDEGAEVFDPRRVLCVKKDCITQIDGVSIYKDDNHIAAGSIDMFEDDLRRALN